MKAATKAPAMYSIIMRCLKAVRRCANSRISVRKSQSQLRGRRNPLSCLNCPLGTPCFLQGHYVAAPHRVSRVGATPKNKKIIYGMRPRKADVESDTFQKWESYSGCRCTSGCPAGKDAASEKCSFKRVVTMITAAAKSRSLACCI